MPHSLNELPLALSDTAILVELNGSLYMIITAAVKTTVQHIAFRGPAITYMCYDFKC